MATWAVRHHARHLHVVVPQGEHRVQPLALAVVERVARSMELRLRRGHHVHHLVVELGARGGVGVDTRPV